MKNRKKKRRLYLKRRAKKKAKRRKLWLDYRRKRNLHRYSSEYKYESKLNEFLKPQIPNDFSLINNPDSVLDFFDKIRRAFINNKPVYFDMSKISNLSPDTMGFMIACLDDSNFNNKTMFKGRPPKNKKLRDLMLKSGFYKYVKSGVVKKDFPDSKIYKFFTEKNVDPELAKGVCLEAIQHTFKNNDIFRPIYVILIELMANTRDHANIEIEGDHNWWLFLFKDTETNISHFTFLDLGVGIFESISHKDILRKVKIVKNKDVVEDLINGRILSSTGEVDRGKGWPAIYKEISTNTEIKNFTLISNDTFANLATNNYFRLKNSLNGTFIYWELHPK